MWTISELAERAGVTRRTIRYYVELGLLPPPQGQGRAALYGPEHLDRLRAITKLQSSRLTLEEIREFLAAETRRPASAAMMAREPSSAADYLANVRADLAPQPQMRVASLSEPSAQYVAEPWMRIPLTDDVELHVRRRTGSERKLGRLIKEARRILEEEENQ